MVSKKVEVSEVVEVSEEVVFWDVLCVVSGNVSEAVVREPIGLFFPQLVKPKSKQNKMTEKMSAEMFFIIILYILSKNNSKKVYCSKKVFPIRSFYMCGFFWYFSVD